MNSSIASFFVFAFLALVSTGAKAQSACPKIDGLVDVNCDGRIVIVTFGDSITRGEGDVRKLGYPGRLRHYFPSAVVVNLGISGEDTGRGKKRARSYFGAHHAADYVILLEGVNDFWDPNHSRQNTESRLFSIMQYAARSGAIVLLGSLTPVTRGNESGWPPAVNRVIAKQVDINFYKLGKHILGRDGLHPNASGYDAMAAMVVNELLNISGS